MLPVALQTETRWGLERGWCRVAKVGEGRRYTKALRTEVTEVVTGHAAE